MSAYNMTPIPKTWKSDDSCQTSEFLALIDQLEKITEETVCKSQCMDELGLSLPADAQRKLIRAHNNMHKLSPVKQARWQPSSLEYLAEKTHIIRHLPISKGGAVMAVSVTPLLRWDEFKHRFFDLSGGSVWQIIAGFISALLALLYGEITLPLGALLLFSSIRLIIGNCPAEGREAYKASSVYIKMYKRFQYFMAPFLLVAIANMAILTLAYTVNISEGWASRLMIFVPAWFALSEGRSAFISLLSYRTPGAGKFYKLGTDLKRSFSDFFSMDE